MTVYIVIYFHNSKQLNINHENMINIVNYKVSPFILTFILLLLRVTSVPFSIDKIYIYLYISSLQPTFKIVRSLPVPQDLHNTNNNQIKKSENLILKFLLNLKTNKLTRKKIYEIHELLSYRTRKLKTKQSPRKTILIILEYLFELLLYILRAM